jgi:hypothetical protein
MLKRIICSTIILIFCVSSLFAQLKPEIEFKMYFEDAAGNSDTITIGYDTLAKTANINPLFGEVDLSAISMDSVFEVRASFSDGYSRQTEPSVRTLPNWYCTSTAHWSLYHAIRISARYWPVTIRWDKSYFLDDECLDWSHITRYGSFVHSPFAHIPGSMFLLSQSSSLIIESSYLRQTAQIGSFAGANTRIETLNNGKMDTIQVLWVGITDGLPTGSITNTSLLPIKTYPSPANHQLSLEVPDCKNEMDVRVFNQIGTEVIHQKVSCSPITTLEVGKLQKGYYQGIATLDDGKRYQFRFGKID